jgi:hypothetical protein
MEVYYATNNIRPMSWNPLGSSFLEMTNPPFEKIIVT